MGALELVIFDCDGTLVDSELLYNTVISEMLNEQGFKQYTPQKCMTLFTGMTIANILKKIERDNKTGSPDLCREDYMTRAQARMDKELRLLPGALEIMQQISQSHRVCVGSNGERSSVIKSLQLTGLFEHFEGGEDHIFTKCQVEQGKPAPDLFLFAAKKMEAEPSRCLVIEDSVPGIHAAVAAGMKAYGFTGSHHDPQSHTKTLEEAGASKVYDSLIHIMGDIKHQKTLLRRDELC